MTDLSSSRFLPQFTQSATGEPVDPDIGTTTTTVPRFRPGDSTETMVPSTTTVPRSAQPSPTTVPFSEDASMPTLDQMAKETEAFAAGITSTNIAEYANDPRYQYTMPPLGLRGVAQPVVRVEAIPGTDFKQEVKEYLLDPDLARNRALERFNREAELVIRNVGMVGTTGGIAGAQVAGLMRSPYDRARPNFIDIDAGDRYTTATDVFKFLNDMTSNELELFKRRLVDLDLLDPKKLGEPSGLVKDINDDVWAAALTLGERANENGIKYQPFFQLAVDNGLKFSSDKKKTSTGRVVPPVRLTSQEDLAFTANQVALRRLGREMTEPEQEAFITSYNQVERDFHRQYYADAQSVVEPPSPQGAIESRIETEFSDEAEMFQMGNVLDSFRAIMAGDL